MNENFVIIDLTRTRQCDAIVFWVKGNSGYSTDFRDARIITRAELLTEFNGCDTDLRFVPVYEVAARLSNSVGKENLSALLEKAAPAQYRS